MASKGQKFRRYSPEEKLKAVKMYLEDGYSIKNISAELRVPNDCVVSRWIKEYQKHGQKYFSQNHRPGRPRKKFRSIEEENEYLKAENAILRAMLESKKKLNTK